MTDVNKKFFTLAHTKSFDRDTRIIESVISADCIDRDFEIVSASVWRDNLEQTTGNYFKHAPICLLSHDAKSIPIARTLSIKYVEGVGAVARIQIADTEAGRDICDNIASIGVASFSIGFLDKGSSSVHVQTLKQRGYDTSGLPRSLRSIKVYHSIELLEISLCSIASNPRSSTLTATGQAWKSNALKSAKINKHLNAYFSQAKSVIDEALEAQTERVLQALSAKWKGIDLLNDDSIETEVTVGADGKLEVSEKAKTDSTKIHIIPSHKDKVQAIKSAIQEVEQDEDFEIKCQILAKKGILLDENVTSAEVERYFCPDYTDPEEHCDNQLELARLKRVKEKSELYLQKFMIVQNKDKK